MAQKTYETFIEEMLLVNPSIEIMSTYTKSKEHVECRCKTCGHLWKATPGNLLSGYGCSICSKKKASDKQRKSHEQFIKEMKELHPTIQVTGKYIGAQSPVDCQCLSCGHEWSPLATNLLGQKGCPICKNKRTSERLTKTHNQFAEEIKTLKPYITLLGKYVDSKTKILSHCNICNYEWSSPPSRLQFGKYGCPRCAKNERYTDKTFKEKLRKINPYIETLEPYVNNGTAILCKCIICNHEWKCKPNNLFNLKGCPSCCHTNTSFFEQVIFGIFSIYFENIEWHNRTLIGKELDIYIPDINVAIEPGTWRWHKEKFKKDLEKRKLCKEKGIRLITIYSDFDENSIPFSEDCIVTSKDLGLHSNHLELKEIITSLLEMCGLKTNISQSEWENIIQQAYKKSRRMSTKEFEEIVHKNLPDISILGEYKGTQNRIECRCETCGNKWSPIANNLLRGHGCNICKGTLISKKITKSHEQFVSEMKEIHPTIKTIDKYQKQKMNVTCQCEICGNTWEASPSNLLQGTGCPYCTEKKVLSGYNDLQTRNPTLAKEWNYKKNNGLMPSDVMPKSGKKVWWTCENEHEWEAPIDRRSSGSGCPYCSNRKVLQGYNDLQTINPTLSNEWNYEKNIGITPSDVMPNSNQKVWWRCNQGHEWQAIIQNRNKGSGCPQCFKEKRKKNKVTADVTTADTAE